jgi:two-component sensor histidine kinase
LLPPMTFSLKLTALFIFLAITGTAQDLTWKEADSLLSVLNKPLTHKDRIHTLLQLASFNVRQRKVSDTMLQAANLYLQDAERLNNTSPSPNITEQILLIRSGLFKAQGKTETGKNMLSRVIERLKTDSNKALLGEAYYDMSEYYSGDFLHETMLERVNYLQLAIAAFQQTNHFIELARCYRFLADLHQLLNDNQNAITEVRTALKYYDQAGYSEKQGALSLLGRIYYEQGDYNQSLHYELTALKIAINSKQDNVRLICQINNNIGYTYIKLNENQKALQFFLQSLQIAEKEKDNETVYLLAANVVDAYLRLKAPQQAIRFFQDITKQYVKPGEEKYESGDYGVGHTYLKIYLALGQYDKARIYCDQLIRLTENSKINLYTLSLYNQIIAKYFIETANYVNAQYYLKKDKDLVNSLKSLSGLAENYKLWFSMDSASGKYKEAIGDMVKANEVKDSIFDETKSRQIAQLEIEYETEKKETQITMLNQKSILESTKLKQADFERNVTIYGVILLLVIAGLLYRQSNFRKKSNIVTTQKNELLEDLLKEKEWLLKEKEWLLKEVHHRVKNNLHTVTCLLELQSKFLENDALRAIKTSQDRIHAMSLIHQKLYQSDNIGVIDTGNYLSELTWHLSESFGSPSNVSLQVMAKDVKLDLSQAISLGLIVNEAITNAYKYAFPDKRAGKIILELRRTDQHIEAIITDNGIGMVYVDNGTRLKSLGLDLMRGLTDDLQGEIFFENDGGTKITVVFPIV